MAARRGRSSFATLAAAVGLAAFIASRATTALAATPQPAAPLPGITLTAEPMLGGVFASGTWAAIRVSIANDGPAVSGELRLGPSTGTGSTYGVGVELATGARQEHFLYCQAVVFGNRFAVSLMSGDTVVATAPVSLDVNGSVERRIFVVAEHPEQLVGPIQDAASDGRVGVLKVTSISVEDLPEMASAWASIDVLVWQDVESTRLGTAQREALQTWVATGGDLLVLGGSAGVSALGGFPSELLPYAPTAVVDVPPADLATALGTLPAGATAVPAVAGQLEQGQALLQSGSNVISARAGIGQGTVALVGVDPQTGWLAGSPAAKALWQQSMPPASSSRDVRLPSDDGFLVNAVAGLPAVQLPNSDQLTLLLIGYIVAIGPLNYVILKRRDRREWAWLTMPLTIATFAVGAYALGVVFKGSSVVISEIAIVQGAAGADRGVADIHVGLFSPSRASYNLRVDPQALLSAPATDTDRSGNPVAARPLDVVLGNPTTLRNYAVSYGALRVFRAEVGVVTPRVDADLRLNGTTLEGTLTNSSTEALEDVSIVYAGAIQVFGDLGPGQSRSVSLIPSGGLFDEPIAQRLYPNVGGDVKSRTELARQAAIEHLQGTNSEKGGFGPAFGFDPSAGTGIFGSRPIVLAWLPVGRLTIDAGTPVDAEGQTLFVLPARVAASGNVVLTGGLIDQTTVSIDASDGFNMGDGFELSHGTITIACRPLDFDSKVQVSKLVVTIGSGGPTNPRPSGQTLAPLPPAEQPASDSPLASSPRPDLGGTIVPRLQLFDRVAGAWVEFEPPIINQTFSIADPQRFVDEAGAFSARFVVRTNDAVDFYVGVRLEGTVQ